MTPPKMREMREKVSMPWRLKKILRFLEPRKLTWIQLKISNFNGKMRKPCTKRSMYMRELMWKKSN